MTLLKRLRAPPNPGGIVHHHPRRPRKMRLLYRSDDEDALRSEMGSNQLAVHVFRQLVTTRDAPRNVAEWSRSAQVLGVNVHGLVDDFNLDFLGREEGCVQVHFELVLIVVNLNDAVIRLLGPIPQRVLSFNLHTDHSC
ncbi:hypothetical protein PMAYCL1PPCAC_05908 [Pristionchus mayeri]|uniref:Uncharacterized protein n=1 Tax=Pristionchus mayeri TaxID=1317129 RepID=A0AAN4ZBY2_9BILA|nr:hypothetical protein PMAYCL1PPCAC_05908 [Pristionchus mayeri]